LKEPPPLVCNGHRGGPRGQVVWLTREGVGPKPCLALPRRNSLAIVRNIPYVAWLDRFHLCDAIR